MIELEKVCFTYNNAKDRCLNGLDLNINSGEFVLICGTSGSGKTSLTRLINKLIPDYYSGLLNGKISINGNPIENYNMYELSEFIGSVFQNPRTQFFNVDTNSEIVFGLENQGLPREELKSRLLKVAKDLEINYLLDRNIFHLSGGEKQKIAFASVYAMNPDIYLLDEPSSNLDLQTIDELKRHLSLLKQKGKTVLISEHRIYYLMDLVDRVIYMNDGKITNVYTKQEFLNLSDEEIKSMGLRSRKKTKIRVNSSSMVQSDSPLQMKNFSLFKKKDWLLEDINFSAQKGDIIAIIGSNGIGKTTFLRALSGLYKDYRGGIFINSREVDPKERMEKSYMVMQDVNYQLFAESVYEECKLGLKKVENSVIRDVLTEFDLIKHIDQHPNTLSGGQKQRLAIAVGLICNKKILILDEPTSGLDYRNMLTTVRLLKKYAQNRIIFIATHDPEFVNLACNRVLNLENYKEGAHQWKY